MQYRDSDVTCMQLLTFLVTHYNYQIVTLRQNQSNDFWLANPLNKEYPVIRLCGDVSTELYSQDTYLKSVHQVILSAVGAQGQLLILNTNELSAAAENEYAKQYVVLPDQIMDEILIKAFPGIESVCHKVENNQEEFLKCTKRLEKKAMNEARQRRKIPVKDLPKLTMVLIAICVAVFILVNLLSLMNGELTSAAIFLGAYYKMSVVSNFEYWRLLSAGFVHADIFHLLMNMMALFNLGFYCEKRYTKKQFLLILLASIVAGNLFVFIGDTNIAGLGISGGLFGLLGAYIVSLCADGSIKNRMVRVNLTSTIMMNVFISLLPNISLMAHLGGFIVGGILAFIMIDVKRWKTLRMHTRNAFILLIVGLCLLVPRVQRIDPFYPMTDAILITTAQKLNLNGYAELMKHNFIKTAESQNESAYEPSLNAALKQLQEAKHEKN